MTHENIWAPWRIKYVQGLAGKQKGCFICKDIENPEKDKENLVVWRTDNCIALLNAYPYNNGHVLIAPKRHISEMEETSDDEMLEMMKLIREIKKALSLSINPHGFNVGINFGRCAGAGLPGHMHIHVVPRWNGDTSFMAVCSNTDVISQSLSELWQLLKEKSKEHDLPDLN